jgi:hypothetical protein
MIATILLLAGLGIPAASLAPMAIAYGLGRRAEHKRIVRAWGESPASVVVQLTDEAKDQLAAQVRIEEKHLREETERVCHWKPAIATA